MPELDLEPLRGPRPFRAREQGCDRRLALRIDNFSGPAFFATRALRSNCRENMPALKDDFSINGHANVANVVERWLFCDGSGK
jgi:hypothetical protein